METGEEERITEEERKEEDDEFPAPPSLGDLEELAREEQVNDTTVKNTLINPVLGGKINFI